MSATETAHHHVVQFYETDADLLAGSLGHLRQGVQAGEAAIVIATEVHRHAFQTDLRDAGLDTAPARADGTLVLLDAADTLARLMPDGAIDRDAFFDVIGGLVRTAAAAGRPVRAYGEMVALLWDAGAVMLAIELESLWNDLGAELNFSLHCGYRSDSVEDPEHGKALNKVCLLHSAVLPAPIDATWDFACDPSAPAAARRLLAKQLRRAGHVGDLLDAAQLIVTELATNAVFHARSPFSVIITTTPAALRIGVTDHSPDPPVFQPVIPDSASGRGIHLISALATRWGTEPTPNGKTVWAELAA